MFIILSYLIAEIELLPILILLLPLISFIIAIKSGSYLQGDGDSNRRLEEAPFWLHYLYRVDFVLINFGKNRNKKSALMENAKYRSDHDLLNSVHDVMKEQILFFKWIEITYSTKI